jgi:mRNA-degrading endonuclease RelE of RelBE toxin-antitoxin system
MVNVDYDPKFQDIIRKIKDNSIKERVKKQITKIINNPEIGKPMKYARKGTREEYVKPFRLSYVYLPAEDKIVFLDLYHKDEQ